MRMLILVAALTLSEAPRSYGLNLTDFITCVGSSGSGSTCQLDSGIWPVTAPIEISRDGLTITGTVNMSGDAILQRTTTLGNNPIMWIDAGLTTTITWLTFDGNRQNVNLCPTTELGYADLDLQFAGLATVQFVDFISSPDRALNLNGTLSGNASTVSYSNFGQGFYYHGYSRTGPQTAARFYGVVVGGDSTGIWYNQFAYAGNVATMLYSGSLQYIVGNNYYSNHYEFPDGISGGQVWIPDQPTYASVANNVIDGANWYSTGKNTGNTDILCTPAPGLYPFGIEASGTGHRYFNNTIQNNTGFGMLLRPYTSTSILSNVTISGYDPFCTGSCTFVPHYITQNSACWTLESCYSTGSGWPDAYGVAGININNYVAGPGGGTGTVSNITLDHVRSTSNSNDGIRIYNAGGTPGFTDSVNGSTYACVTGNSVADLVTSGSASGYNSYINSCP